jgi:branched-chain amino acid transport system permease protein
VGEFFGYALPGIPSGCTFALVAVGLVLTYQATGVFNFAFGSEAYAAGVIYAELITHGVNPALAGAIVVFVVAPAFGALLDFGFFSRIPSANATARIVVSLGVMVILPEVVELVTNNVNIYGPPPPFLPPNWYTRWGDVIINAPELSTLIATVAVLVALTFMLRTRRLGLPIRAAVESPKLLELNGVDSRRVIRQSWMISTSLAGLAGVLYAAQYPLVDWLNYSIIVVAAIAAAALGGLRSLTLAGIGGVGLGVVQGVIQGYLPTDSIWYQALVPSLPFFILLALLVLHPGMRRLRENRDPMAAVEPPPPPPALALRSPHFNQVLRRFRWPLLAAALIAAATYGPDPWILALTVGSALAIIFLSITLMTGIAGQLSLAQAAFAGIGACTTAQLADNLHVPVLLAAAAGAAVAGLGGVAAALPALRLRGLPIALLTLCLALLADNLLFPTSWIGGGINGLPVTRPHIFGINMNGIDSRGFFILVFGVLLAATGVVHAILRGTTGRALAAVHASAVGAASSGVAVRRMTILLFLMSAGIAGLGGAFYAMSYQNEFPVDFNWFFGPTFLVIVVTVGVTTVEGAIVAGMGFALFTEAVSYLPTRLGSSSSGSTTLTILVLSIGAFTYASHTEGIFEFAKRRLSQLVFRARPPELSASVSESAP